MDCSPCHVVGESHTSVFGIVKVKILMFMNPKWLIGPKHS